MGACDWFARCRRFERRQKVDRRVRHGVPVDLPAVQPHANRWEINRE
jgi:hypothetical protein